MSMKKKIRLHIARQTWPVITNGSEIAEAVGCDRSTLKRAIKEMESEGTLERRQVDRNNSQYILLSPPGSTLEFLARSKKIITEDFAKWKKKSDTK